MGTPAVGVVGLKVNVALETGWHVVVTTRAIGIAIGGVAGASLLSVRVVV
jgi:hypothetical protein